MSSPHPRTHNSVDERPRKRRKIRKGTTSCWECKRRKIKCRFPSSSSTVCDGCKQRRTSCLTQDYDNLGDDDDSCCGGTVKERLKKAEELIQQLLQSSAHQAPERTPQDLEAAALARAWTPHGVSGDGYSISAQVFDGNCSAHSIQAFDAGVVNPISFAPQDLEDMPSLPPHGMTDEICCKLHAALPSQHDADLIIAAGNTAIFLQFFTRPYKELFEGDMRTASSLSALPSQESHPVLLARALLYLGNGIQNLPTSFRYDQLTFDRFPTKTMRYLVDTACHMVTSNDEMLHSLEGLECLILEGVFYINSGDLRRALLVFRRAIGLGQLMGLHRRDNQSIPTLDPDTKASPSVLWHRIVSQDRYLALMLDLPAGTTCDPAVLPEIPVPNNCPADYLERVHSLVTGLIVARNGRKIETRASHEAGNIASMLEKAAQRMPLDWWQLPVSKGRSAEKAESFKDLLRALFHVSHFSLLILLQLPYMLHSITEGFVNDSQSICVNASRELLNRYVRFRCMKQVAFCCASIDFSAFIASVTLLAAHINRSCQNSGHQNALAHHRLSDRALINETIDLMRDSRPQHGDVPVGKIAYLLRKLIDIESNASKDASNHHDEEDDSLEDTTVDSLRLQIPYFGIVNITKYGIFSVSARSLLDNSTLVPENSSNFQASPSFHPPASSLGSIDVSTFCQSALEPSVWLRSGTGSISLDLLDDFLV